MGWSLLPWQVGFGKGGRFSTSENSFFGSVLAVSIIYYVVVPDWGIEDIS